MTNMSTMTTLRTFKQVFLHEMECVYAVVALPEWKHYDLEKCPAPIQEWIQQHYPDVVIEQLAGFAFESATPVSSEYPDGVFRERLPEPIFRLGFNEEQAEHFEQAWTNPPLDTPDSPSEFYFLIYDDAEDLQSWGVADSSVPVTVGPSGP